MTDVSLSAAPTSAGLAPAQMMTFHVPEDPDLLRAFGVVSIRHSHLDHVLRMTIKSLTNLSVEDAISGTAREGSSALRESIKKLARKAIGECPEKVRLFGMLERCRQATDKRNALTHNVWAQDVEGGPAMLRTDHGWASPPTVAELEQLERELARLVSEINEFRLRGSLADLLRKKFQTGA